MKAIRNILVFGTGLVLLLNRLHAQQTDFTLESAMDLQTMLEAIEQATPTPAASLPKYGTFWSAQFPYGSRGGWPPLPGNILGLDAWALGDGNFLLNDTNVDYDALQADADAAAAASRPMMRLSVLTSLASSYAYLNPVYLTNMAASLAYDGSTTASFGIGGGTNFVPYDILMSTNVAAPVASWNWLGIGYTSNNYTFYEQPASLGFYILAKPSKTMVAGFGNDSVAQCDVPYALTNALQVVGGGGQSLALKTDGTVVAWGANYYGEGVVPTNLVGVAMIAAGWYHNVALLTNGTVTAWGLNLPALGYYLTNVPASLTNATVISAQALHSLALTSNGTVVAWGYDSGSGVTNVPAGLSNVVAISAGYLHNLAVTTNGNGTVTAWGNNSSGQCNVPAGLSNVVDVAAGIYHSLALLQNGTVRAWGDNAYGEASVPAGLTNVVAIAAAGDPGYGAYSLALKNDGTVVAWGEDEASDTVGGLNDVIGIAAGADHALAVRTGPATPVITLEPVDEYQVQGSNATFTARGAGLYGVTYQWQTNGVNLSGATSAALTLTNVQTAQLGISYGVVVGNEMGSLASSNANFYFVTPPVITSKTLPTNQVAVYLTNLVLNVVATAPGIYNGFPLSYQWQFNGTNLAGATAASYIIHPVSTSFGTYSVLVSNAAGSTNAVWQVTVYYPGGLAITQQPTNQYQVAGGSISFYGSGVGSNSVAYQWTFNGTNLAGATNAFLTLTNVTAAQQGYYNFILSSAGSSLTSSNANFYLVTPPVITSQSSPKNRICIEGNYLSFAATAAAPYQTNGYPLSYQWQFNGTNIPYATSTNYATTASNSGIYSLVVTNLAGSTNASWQVTLTNAINVTNDLLLIYNTNSADSLNVLNYYLAHRPGVSGANVLGIGWTGFVITNFPGNSSWVGVTNETDYETISPGGFTNQILNPVLNWLASNPTKRPQYVILMLAVPSRINDRIPNYDPIGDPFLYPGSSAFPSVSYALSTNLPDWRPFITHLNMNGTNDCIAYINKLANFGTNYSPGQLAISARAGGYGNTNWYFDDSNTIYPSYAPALGASNGVAQSGVASASIVYTHAADYNLGVTSLMDLAWQVI